MATDSHTVNVKITLAKLIQNSPYIYVTTCKLCFSGSFFKTTLTLHTFEFQIEARELFISKLDYNCFTSTHRGNRPVLELCLGGNRKSRAHKRM